MKTAIKKQLAMSNKQKATQPKKHFVFFVLFRFSLICLTFNFMNFITNCLAQTANETGAGNCLSFDGTSDYVSVTTSPLIADISNSTVEAWFIATDVSSVKHIYSEDDASGTIFHLRVNNGKIEYGIKNNLSWKWATGNTPIQIGQWYHASGVLNSAEGMKVFLNGVLDGTNLNTQPVDLLIATIEIGAQKSMCCCGGYCSFFNGQIDEVRIWNRALTQEEIRQNMCQKLKGNENGLVGYWRFNEASGNTAYDASGNGNNGTLY